MGTLSASSGADRRRLRLCLQGALQGVGFRPFVHRLAQDCALAGWVLNSPSGVELEVEGALPDLRTFRSRLAGELPPHAFIQSREELWLDPAGYSGFVIRPSTHTGPARSLVLPDIAPCPECRREMFDPADRRHRYPFINCTRCGPRFTIIAALPYDRPNTSMAGFPLCPACAREYADPADRRFHAQPVACPACGPALAFRGPGGQTGAAGEEALRRAVRLVREGGILALKGVGGFHLLVRADDDAAVRMLRRRKRRDEKPFAVMMRNPAEVAGYCRLSPQEEEALTAPETPIVLLEASGRGARLAPAVAPDNPLLGVLLPPSPLHLLFLEDLALPVVATSGNLSEEPICIRDDEAAERLGTLADGFLVHDRPILRHADDSIVRVIGGSVTVLRRARGIAPLPVHLPAGTNRGILGAGAHLKNTVAVAHGRNCFLSQHIGDLATPEAHDAFRNAAEDLQRMFGRAEAVACDMHPEYLSTRFAQASGLPVEPVQHHAAHAAACMAENGLDGTCLGVSWDGTGFGPDGSVWGGEFFLHEAGVFHRVGSLRAFRLPGGERAVREPRRSALGMLSIEGLEADLAGWTGGSFAPEDRSQLLRMTAAGFNSPWTTSAGRLFDGAASLLGIRHVSAFEGQAAMALEFAASAAAAEAPYALPVENRDGFLEADWRPVVRALLADTRLGVPAGTCAYRFHAALAQAIVETAARVGCERVLLSGGCFQNRLLTELAEAGLSARGFRVYRHQRVPPNDGGIALGQIYAAILAGRGSVVNTQR